MKWLSQVQPEPGFFVVLRNLVVLPRQSMRVDDITTKWWKSRVRSSVDRTNQYRWMVSWCVQRRNAPYEMLDGIMVRSKAERTLRNVGWDGGAFKDGTHITKCWMVSWCVQKRNAPYEMLDGIMVRSKAERTLRNAVKFGSVSVLSN